LELDERGQSSYPEHMDGIMMDLERKGLVRRSIDPNTKVRHAHLTDTGRRSLSFLFDEK
jgi:DNA-binding MarR family transcriptional regulator